MTTSSLAAAEKLNMAIIGAGNVGGRLAVQFAKAGHNISLGVRNVQKPEVQQLLAAMPNNLVAMGVQEAAANANVLVLSVPFKALQDCLDALGPQPGKLIIDTINASFRGGSGVWAAIEKTLQTDRIVKAFNTIGAENLDNLNFEGQKADQFLCGNYAEDKALVAELSHQIGFGAVHDVGGKEAEQLIEQLALLWGKLAFGPGQLGRSIAFKVLRK